MQSEGAASYGDFSGIELDGDGGKWFGECGSLGESSECSGLSYGDIAHYEYYGWILFYS